MHRKQDLDLLPTDTELEITLRSLRKTKRAENAAMTNERHDQTEEQRTVARRPPITDTMEDFGGLSFRKNILQLDSLLWMQITLN